MTYNKQNKSVLVVGAGISGIQAALDLAELGADVHLVEETPSIGGRMPQLDKTFPTNDCSLCILAPKMSECARHPGITLHTYSSLASISGEVGNFSCQINEFPKYVDPQKCVGCGICEQKCPTKIMDEFDMGLRQRKAIYRYFLQSIPSNYVIDAAHCLYLTKGACRLCEKECTAGAINFEDKAKTITLSCGAIVLATGIDPYNPISYGEYGYKKFKNVITSLEFERLLSASGPQKGHIVRFSDGKPPQKIAFIQCVGSRDVNVKNEYCSSVCCMYAIKEAIIAKEHIKNIEPSIFFMDIRAYGKDFDKYYERAKAQSGVRFVRSKVAEINETNGGSLSLRYTQEDGKLKEESFDMVVLSVGLEPRKGIDKMSDKSDIKLDEYGFCRTGQFTPLATTKEGIFVIGGMSGPKDIPESVMAASGTVAECAKFLALERQAKVSKKVYPPELNVIGDRPRIGVFVCHCGINIAGVVDVEKVAEVAQKLPNVDYAQTTLYACSQDSLNIMKDKVKEHNLNRVIVAACTPRTHEPLFRETLREAGLNQYLFEMSNIRDQCSWAHMNEPELATQKAKDLVSMAVAKARNLNPLDRLLIQVNPKAIVIGGGLSGMVSALAIAEAGYEVVIIEKDSELGGNLKNIYYTLDGKEVQKLLKETIDKVKSNPLITTYTNAKIDNISGYIGNFKTQLSVNGNGLAANTEIEHGIIVVATGAEEYKSKEYLYGEDARIITQLELEKRLSVIANRTPQTEHRKPNTDTKAPKTVVMIQCVGSREKDRLYCSRVCCSEAVKNAIEVKRIYPNADVYVLYRDVRTYGLMEKYYTKARENGVVFIRYEPEYKPQVEILDKEDINSKLRITTIDPLLESKVIIEADLVVLSCAIDAPTRNKELAKLLKVPLNADGFFLEAHAKLRPVDFATDGVFICGLAHGPKDMEESIIQAKGAAGRALTVLSRQTMEAEGTICWVNPIRCTACGVCVEVCAYSAIEIKEKEILPGVVERVAEINEALCKGCGVCAASCRCSAIDLKGFTDEQIFEAIGAGSG
ncbi:MAG: CoB--CoM heterodisulfide reductase iron-sulfur subunit A family protein [Candidatus Stahlbacteria bacterium]|nr:CoB--CoM heterodisulfide reductase iron-sulfur subunit A family protein [Candidatus Stahlbacteria bacterium]